MKKLLIFAFTLLCFTSAAMAEIGLGLRLGGGQDDNNFKSEIASSDYSFSENNGLVGLEGFWEQGGLYGLGEDQIFGIKVGVQKHGELEYKNYDSYYRETYTNNVYEFPITAYYKYVIPETQLNIWGGIGATISNTEWENKDMDTSDSFTKKNSKVFPHIKGGVEWRACKLFGLGLDLGYNFGGEFKYYDLKRDISGFEGALAARFYFQ